MHDKNVCSVDYLNLYPDTSGLTRVHVFKGTKADIVVTMAGYTGTATVGMFLLLFRKTNNIPK